MPASSPIANAVSEGFRNLRAVDGRRWWLYAVLLTPAVLLAAMLPDWWLMNQYQVRFAVWYQSTSYPLFGDTAYTKDWYGWLGFGIHFLIGFAWAFAYMTVAVFVVPKLSRSVFAGSVVLWAATWVVMQGGIDLPIVQKNVTGILVANTLIAEVLWAVPIALTVFVLRQMELHDRWPFRSHQRSPPARQPVSAQ